MYDVIIDDLLPQALLIGVDYNVFWELNPKTLKPFHKAFVLGQELDDANAWSSGLYIRMAIASVMDSKSKYPEKPFHSKYVKKPMTQEEIKERFLDTVELINKNFKKEV